MTLKSKPKEKTQISKENILTLYKKRGETPLECLERFKKDNPEYKMDKMTYAGRLDPLAEGLLLVLVGEECKNKEKYLGVDKEYEVDVLFGFATDTYDVLGKVLQSDVNTKIQFPDESIFLSFIGKFSQEYPEFSSRNIKGILEMRNNLGSQQCDLDKEILEKDVEIKDIKITGGRTMSKIDLEKYIKDSVNLVKGDFRQTEILESWRLAMANFISETHNFIIISIHVNCTSGTYMRSLANNIGEKVGIPALALNIKRTSVGKLKW